MARRTNYRRKTTTNRRRRRPRAKMSTNSSGYSTSMVNPLPRTFKAHFRYCENAFALNPTIGGLASDAVFSLNNLHDPYVSGGGHQPAGWDELKLLYKYYTVIGAKVHVSFQNTDTTNESLVLTHINTDSTAITDVRRIVENGNCTFTFLTKSGGSKDICAHTTKASIKKVLGVRNLMDNDNTRSLVTGGPSDQVYLHVVAAPNSGVDAGLVGCNVIIDYICIFSEPLLANLS